MSAHKEQSTEEKTTSTQYGFPGPCIGRLAGTNNRGDVLVECEDMAPHPAKLLAGMKRDELVRPEQRGREVLILFEKGDPRQPIIVGLMEDRLESLISFEVQDEQAGESKDVLVDGKRVTIEAQDEVMLKCGKGSILIRKDGKIIIKGTDILSRSSGAQRVRGASVSIN